MENYKITKVEYQISSSNATPNMKCSKCILPTEIPSNLSSLARSKSHSDFQPAKQLVLFSSSLGYDVQFNKSIGYGTYGKCYLGSKLPEASKSSHVENKAFTAGQQTVCIKVTDVERLSSNYRYHFMPRENYALSIISGENLVHTFDTVLVELIFAKDKCYRYFVTIQEYLPHSLQDLIYDQKGKRQYVPYEVIRRIAVHLIDGISSMHQQGVSHRDLKIGNLMLSADFNVKLIDFGLCHLSDISARENVRISSETWCGTKKHFSPELILRQEYQPKLYDSWLTGLVIYECSNSVLPDIFEMVSRKGHFDDNFIAIDSNVPEDLKIVIKNLLVQESKRMQVNETKKLSFYVNYDETKFWNEYNSGKIKQVFKIFDNSSKKQ